MRRLAAALVALGCLGLVACVPVKQGAPSCSPSSTLAFDIFEATNIERANVGVSPVEWDQPTAESARRWSEQMTRDGPHHSPPVYHPGVYAENVGGPGWCGVTANDFMRTWMNPITHPGHRAAILSPDHDRLGVGVASGIYATQVFRVTDF